MKRNHNFAVTIFILGIVSNIMINYVFPNGLMTKSQVVIESIALGLFFSGLILVLKSYVLETFIRRGKNNEHRL